MVDTLMLVKPFSIYKYKKHWEKQQLKNLQNTFVVDTKMFVAGFYIWTFNMLC